MVKKVDGTKLGSKMSSDFDSIKELFGRPKNKSYKQLYEEKVREHSKQKVEAEYKAKLEALEKEELDEKLAPVKKGFSKLKELIK